jgi:hypothetical protein
MTAHSKVSSRELYAILRTPIAPVAKQAGFKRLKSGMLGWTRPESDRHLSFWFQCDHYGWFEDFGSKFTLEFQLTANAAPGSGTFAERVRFGELLTDQERETVRVTNNNVLQSLPPPGPRSPVAVLPAEQRQWFLSGYRIRLDPYEPTHDIWLHYFTRRDVDVWAAFFADRLPRMISDFARREAR